MHSFMSNFAPGQDRVNHRGARRAGLTSAPQKPHRQDGTATAANQTAPPPVVARIARHRRRPPLTVCVCTLHFPHPPIESSHLPSRSRAYW